jgi:peptide/nickel transport system substrate-binding protein
MNFGAGIFADQELRQAMTTALDRASIVESAFQGLSAMQQDFWPEKLYPAGILPISSEVDLAPLEALVPSLPSKKIDLAWVTSYGAPAQTVAELIQTQLAPTGLDITIRAMPSAESFDLVNQPPGNRPDIMVAGIGGDALHLDTAVRIFLRTGAEPLNYFQYADPEVDRLMDVARSKPTTEEANEVYRELTEILRDEALWIPFCPRPDNLILHNYLGGLRQNSYLPYVFTANRLRRT